MSQHGCPERLSSRSKGFSEEGTSQPTMEVLVETLTGTAFEMTVSPSDTIFAIKSKIFRVEGIPVCQQHLLYNLHELEDGRSLHEQRVVDGARLRLVLALRGGPVATRRLPPPPPVRRDLDRLLDANRDEASGGGGGGCKVTVVVVREGERVSVLRVLENEDGTYSPLTHHHTYSSSLRSLSEDGVECDSDSGSGGEDGLCAVHENAVTMGKMMELRRRMETLSLQRSSRPVRQHQPRSPRHQNDRRVETQDVIQKTRSEETLAVSSLFEERALRHCRAGSFLCSEPEEGFAPLYDGSYTRLDYDCPFADRYALLPPIGVRADSDHSLRDALDADTLAGSLLVKEETAILEEGAPECHRPHPCGPPQPRTHAPLAHALSAAAASPPATADYGPLVSGEASGWRAHTFGSSSQLVGGAIGGPGGALTATGGGGASAVTSGRLSAGPHSASSLQLRAPPPRHHPPLSDAVFSSSTSDLEALRRNRLLPALSRHPNTEHLHLSDDRLNRQRRAPHALEVGSERRQRRVNAVLSELAPGAHSPTPSTQFAQVQPPEKKSGGRMRCALCRRRLTVATVHTCRCGGEFCAPHRYAEAHGCHYDYKALAATRQHPPLAAPKLPKI